MKPCFSAMFGSATARSKTMTTASIFAAHRPFSEWPTIQTTPDKMTTNATAADYDRIDTSRRDPKSAEWRILN
jgi:hypothetical protein